jgi:hypothetical protein
MTQAKKQARSQGFKQKPKSSHKYFGNSLKKHDQLFTVNPTVERLVRAFLLGSAAKPTVDTPMELLVPLLANQKFGPHAVCVVGQFHRGLIEDYLEAEVVSQCALEGYSARRILNVLKNMVLETELGKANVAFIDEDHDEIVVPIYSTIEAVYVAAREVVFGYDIQAGIFSIPQTNEQ